MATKVKGEAIKEGSIPMSALAKEVKDKIENAGGGADWNAQEGEAGYIENKPFNVTSVKNVHFGADNWEISNGAYLYVAKSSHNGIYIDNVGYFKFGYCMSQEFSIDGAGIITVYVDSYGFPIIENQDYFETDEEAAEFLNAVLKIVHPGEIYDAFIPDTVIKTTPQTLSNTDKNQALTNLGIDPVVWKYICNPYIIDEGYPEGTIPEELISIIFDIDGNLKPIVQNLIVFVGNPIRSWSGNELYYNDAGGSIIINYDGTWERV